MPIIDVIIPTYKPDRKFLNLIDMLDRQTVPVNKIIIMNTEEKYFDRLVYGSHFMDSHSNMEVYHHSQREFDHGKTRCRGVKRSDADIFVCMTQDAVPENEYLLEELVRPLSDETTAAAYARQLPDEHAGSIERFTRSFNYPEQPAFKSEKDIGTLGIKTFFCSNVCAAYRRDIYDKLGGFIRHAIFNEDMIYAAGAIHAGYQIAYVPSAAVIHSHEYTNMQQFHRNFDVGVSQAQHPEIFAEVPSENEGKKLVRLTAEHLRKTGSAHKIPGLIVTSGCKWLGYKLGKKYHMLPPRLVRWCSMNRHYWD